MPRVMLWVMAGVMPRVILGDASGDDWDHASGDALGDTGISCGCIGIWAGAAVAAIESTEIDPSSRGCVS